MAYEIISADTHLDLHWLPPDLFVSRAPEAQKPHMPNVQTLDRGNYWFVQGREFCPVGSDSVGVPSGTPTLPVKTSAWTAWRKRDSSTGSPKASTIQRIPSYA